MRQSELVPVVVRTTARASTSRPVGNIRNACHRNCCWTSRTKHHHRSPAASPANTAACPTTPNTWPATLCRRPAAANPAVCKTRLYFKRLNANAYNQFNFLAVGKHHVIRKKRHCIAFEGSSLKHRIVHSTRRRMSQSYPILLYSSSVIMLPFMLYSTTRTRTKTTATSNCLSC